jgi:hypothetical protein
LPRRKTSRAGAKDDQKAALGQDWLEKKGSNRDEMMMRAKTSFEEGRIFFQDVAIYQEVGI